MVVKSKVHIKKAAKLTTPVETKKPYPMPDHGIRGLLFDLDGVLVDAADWHRDAFNLALEVHNFPALSQEEHMKDFNGLSSRRKLRMLVERERVPDDNALHESIHKAKQEYTVKLIEENCEPIARVIDVLVYARSVKLLTGCVTNCSRETAELMLTKARLIDKFDTIVTNNDVDGKIKPHPWPYILAKNNLGFANQWKKCIAIDDTGKGIISAVEAGCRTWWLKDFKDLNVRNLMSLMKSLRITI